MKSSPSIWQLLHTVKLAVKILSIFVAFSENVNFTFPQYGIDNLNKSENLVTNTTKASK